MPNLIGHPVKHKAYDIDAAKLRAGMRSEDFDEVTEDDGFYMVVEQKGTVNEESGAMPGRMLVGRYNDWSSWNNNKYRYRLQIAEADGTVETSDGTTNVSAGISMEHQYGINIRSGEAYDIFEDDRHVGLVGYGVENYTPNEWEYDVSVDNDIDAGQIKLGAYRGISLSTIDLNGDFIDKGIVSLQDDMLRVYNDDDYGYLDSVSDEVRFVSREASGYFDPDNLYTREDGSTQGLFLLGDMDFVLSTRDEGYLGGTNTDDIKQQPVVDIKAKRSENYISSRFSGGFAIYDYDVSGTDYPDVPAWASTSTSTSTAGEEGMGNPSLYVGKGDFQILATDTYKENDVEIIKKGDIILQVDNNSDTNVIADDGDRGSVYIRKGAINMASTNPSGTRLTNSDIQDDYNIEEGFAYGIGGTVYPVGYIAADRFIAHMTPSDGALNASERGLSGGKVSAYWSDTLVPYERYEVNPAYTSVMHDIKLTTRGGARLSDILPDFINKGIYVVDNTYSEDVSWAGSSTKPSKECSGDSMECYTSAYLGFVPTPTCPQGYAKVITINPSGWAMAQAGTPVLNSGYIDISTHNNPYLYWYTNDGTLRTQAEEVEAVNPLTFQKSTWLKAMVMPYCNQFIIDSERSGCPSDTTFEGWGAVLGFVYPQSYYSDFIDGTVNGKGVSSDKGVGEIGTMYDLSSATVYWNLYPVQYRQLEAYVTVYCYFNRTDFPDDMVDTTYDQLDSSKFRNYWEKVSTDNIEYMERLNDPALKYNDPW